MTHEPRFRLIFLVTVVELLVNPTTASFLFLVVTVEGVPGYYSFFAFTMADVFTVTAKHFTNYKSLDCYRVQLYCIKD